MKIVQINATCGIGSTGKIAVDISKTLCENGIENYILYSSKTNGYKFGIGCGSDGYIKRQALKSRLLGNYGFNSKKATRKMIAEMDRINPDIVHLHNIHGHDCNLELLFMYLKNTKTKIIWTFHDCWAFTGYCTHFTLAKCDKWKTGCRGCTQRGIYSWLFDRSKQLFEKKKSLFCGADLTVVTPSRWLADLAKQSFLKDCSIEVINNGIDLDIFRPTDSDFKRRYDIENKIIVLGVSFGWGYAKGLDVFAELARRLPDEYKIVLVGTDEKAEKVLPDNVISVRRTQDQKELAEIYTAADVFVSASREENYPTVHMEAVACGTPVATFNAGGSSEIVDPGCGVVVECDNVDLLEKEILRICTDKPFPEASCINSAKKLNKNERFKEYLNLYERINTTRT